MLLHKDGMQFYVAHIKALIPLCDTLERAVHSHNQEHTQRALTELQSKRPDIEQLRKHLVNIRRHILCDTHALRPLLEHAKQLNHLDDALMRFCYALDPMLKQLELCLLQVRTRSEAVVSKLHHVLYDVYHLLVDFNRVSLQAAQTIKEQLDDLKPRVSFLERSEEGLTVFERNIVSWIR